MIVLRIQMFALFQNELMPSNCLADLLTRFKAVCERIDANATLKAQTSTALLSVNNEVWALNDQKATRSGRCGEDKAASGEATFKIAKFVPQKLAELSAKLAQMTRLELDEHYCLEICARSLVLQIQWIVVDLNKHFLIAEQLGFV